MYYVTYVDDKEIISLTTSSCSFYKYIWKLFQTSSCILFLRDILNHYCIVKINLIASSWLNIH